MQLPSSLVGSKAQFISTYKVLMFISNIPFGCEFLTCMLVCAYCVFSLVFPLLLMS